MSHKERYSIFAVFLAFCALVLFLTAYLSNRAQEDSRELLERSVKSLLITTASSAREMIDPALYESFNGPEAADNESYRDTLFRLRLLAGHAGAKYIYTLKQVEGEYIVLFDTDPEDSTIEAYEPDEVHFSAFEGRNTAGISNLVDEWGSYSTGAVPIHHNGQIIGIVAVDIEDNLLRQNDETAKRNLIITLVLIGTTLLLMSILLFLSLGRMQRMQNRLKHMAHYDKLTNLPNRQYLLDYLSEVSTKGKSNPYALFFIDLDNFKKVNDNAGHDAGDALLQNIGQYLEVMQENNKVFRPGPGMLNIAARIGGDEFVLVVPGIQDESQAASFASELITNFRQNEIDRYIEKYEVGLSIGISLYPHNASDYNVLIKYADIAMYHAKFGGKNNYRVYNDEMKAPKEK